MHRIIIDQPYEFVPPYPGRMWSRLAQWYTPRYLRRTAGIESIAIEHADRLVASIRAGHGVLLAPNHTRGQDPMVMSQLARAAGTHFFTMASWHVFMQGWLKRQVAWRAGAFSVYREGMDRQAVNTAIDILAQGARPLVIFPEGVLSRANDRLGNLMEGVALIARQAARKREKDDGAAGGVVVHPVALRYTFEGDVEAAVRPVLAEIERRLTWRVRDGRPLVERLIRVGTALLAVKEIEYMGHAQEGPLAQRVAKLIDAILQPIEAAWLPGQTDHGLSVVARVKRVRMAVLPDLVEKQIDEAERARRWRHLEDVYLAQQLSMYPPDYVGRDPKPTRIVETVERFEEDMTDDARPYTPMRVTIRVGKAISVAGKRPRGGDGDPLMQLIEAGLRAELELDNGDK